jgi:hypothetical protein
MQREIMIKRNSCRINQRGRYGWTEGEIEREGYFALYTKIAIPSTNSAGSIREQHRKTTSAIADLVRKNTTGFRELASTHTPQPTGRTRGTGGITMAGRFQGTR